jgi:hypothetical protein
MSQLPPIAPPSIFTPRPLRVWLVIGLFVVYLIVSYLIFFEAIAPVADFSIQPAIAADSAAYWDASGVRTINVADQQYAGPDAGSNLFGPVIEAEVLRTDLNVALANSLLFILCLSLLRSMPEFDRATFLLLMMINPLLLASLITLNKEIFALSGIIVFIRYTAAKRFRLWWLALAISLSFFARYQQAVVMLMYVAFESRLSPWRGRPRRGIAVATLIFTVGYGLVYHVASFLIKGWLAQAEQGRTILFLDNIQANFGFPLVAIPKIMMNCMGRLVTPAYYLTAYPYEDFTNWRDMIFMQIHTLVLTTLFAGMLYFRKLRLNHAPVYLLVLYLLMTAVNPMVQPRYEYAAYVLLCLEASRYFRLGLDGVATAPTLSQNNALSPSLG